MNGRKIAFKPVGIAAGALGSVVFRQMWKKLDRGRDVPESTDMSRNWSEVMVAAALQGAVFAVIHAVVDRASVKPERASLPGAGEL